MAIERSPSAPGASRARIIRRFPASRMSFVEKRLASAEGELRVQFTRIAQLQAELDLLAGTLRRLSDAVEPDRFGQSAQLGRGVDLARDVF